MPALALYAASRLAVLLASIPAALHAKAGAGPWPVIRGGSSLERVFTQWDGAWYIWVADRGYPTGAEYRHHLSDVAFFPAFPALIRGFASVTGLSTLHAATLVSFVLGAAATVLVWQLAARLVGRDKANRATALFVFFPGAFVLSMAYAETLMIVAAAACLLLLLDRRWTWAGMAGAVATATRPNGIAVLVACAVVAAVAIARRREWPALAAPLLAACGLGSFFTYLWLRTGHINAWFESERIMWHDHFSAGASILRRIGRLFTRPPTSLDPGRLNDLIATIGVLLAIAALVWLVRTAMPLAVKAYTIAALVIPMLSYAVGPRPRMLLAAFPLAALLAGRLPARAYNVVLGTSIVLLVALTYVTTTTLAAVP
jgi:Dolichyl-phosphate-mannose-protein mannosyltransferase